MTLLDRVDRPGLHGGARDADPHHHEATQAPKNETTKRASGVTTGYAIKRAVDRSTRFFWAASLAQVYPELAALEEGGDVVGTDEPRGDRPRRTYRLTDKGQAALQEWLRSERVPDFEQRDEGLLRILFADALPADDALALVRRLRARAEEVDAHFQAEILPLARRVPGRFRLIVAREGADYFAWRAAWFRSLEAELAAELGSESTRSDVP